MSTRPRYAPDGRLRAMPPNKVRYYTAPQLVKVLLYWVSRRHEVLAGNLVRTPSKRMPELVLRMTLEDVTDVEYIRVWRSAGHEPAYPGYAVEMLDVDPATLPRPVHVATGRDGRVAVYNPDGFGRHTFPCREAANEWMSRRIPNRSYDE